MATNTIDTASKRNKLTIKCESHWHNFTKGRSLGGCKTKSGGTWVIKHGRKQSRLVTKWIIHMMRHLIKRWLPISALN